jgi:hypothetical protein
MNFIILKSKRSTKLDKYPKQINYIGIIFVHVGKKIYLKADSQDTFPERQGSGQPARLPEGGFLYF